MNIRKALIKSAQENGGISVYDAEIVELFDRFDKTQKANLNLIFLRIFGLSLSQAIGRSTDSADSVKPFRYETTTEELVDASIVKTKRGEFDYDPTK